MIGLSEQIIRNLTQIANEENEKLPQWIDKKYVANCIIPPLSGENNVHCSIAVAALVSGGKSTLFDAVCGYPILPVASKTTSSVPTYITRVNEQAQESVTVYGIKKEVIKKDNLTSTRFVRDTTTRRTYYARDISKEMFDDLFEYMYFINHGTEVEYKTTIENVAYFMKTVEKSDILFYGSDNQKRTITKDDFALNYETPRHRLLLLLILLCVYVDQNVSAENMSEYIKELNQQRTTLFEKYNFPTGSDYCVCLDWCNDDIPENVTLIDLPGTGSSTEDTDTQSAHTKLVRGILTEADAIWVLCSDNGVVDADLLLAIKDVIEGGSRKNKVCIYNCKNGNPNDSGPVIEFLKKIPCLTGERCYVVNALAGEYKYTQNGVNALMTKTASDKRSNDFEEPTESAMIKKLEFNYNNEKKANCTFTTSRDNLGNIIAVQDNNHRYTLDTFFKKALADYIERLKYEVVLTEAIEQAKFYIYIRDSLTSSRSILEEIDGKSEDITKAVTEALSIAKRQALDNYVRQITKFQTDLAKELNNLGNSISKKIGKAFLASLTFLIEKIKRGWETLETKGHYNCLEANIWGNYPLKENHPNTVKFKRVRTSTKNRITITAFDDALEIADTEIKKYKDLLTKYTDTLKKVTKNFVNDYVNTFVASFDKKRDELCEVNEKSVTEDIYQNFNSTRDNLKKTLEKKLNALCEIVCDSFDVLTNDIGIFDKICDETSQVFRDRFCENILDVFRKFMYETFDDTHYIGFIKNSMSPGDLHKILNDDFSRKKTEYAEILSHLIINIYGLNAGDANFPQSLSLAVLKFNNDRIKNSAIPKIEDMHNNITSLVDFGASMVVDLTAEIENLDKAIGIWTGIGERYKNLREILEDSDAENTKKLYDDCTSQIDKIITGSKK